MRHPLLWIALPTLCLACSNESDLASNGGYRSSTGGSTADATSPDGTACVSPTCQELGVNCGRLIDSCASTLDCGECASGLTCGGDGPNRCGTNVCIARTCSSVGAVCGPISDGCGSISQCGDCLAPAVCGLVVSNQCATPDAGTDAPVDPPDAHDSGCIANACGGCSALPGMPGGMCGGCGAYQCAGAEALSCDDPCAPFSLTEVDGQCLPSMVEGYVCGACSGSFDYQCPSGYVRVSCDDSMALGTHGCCADCIVAHVRCQKAPGFGFAEDIGPMRGYACATCDPPFTYACPAGYTRTACSGQPTGSHNCCTSCAVVDVTCAPMTVADFQFTEVASDCLPSAAEGYVCAFCSGNYEYQCPTGYVRTSCDDTIGLGDHGCCPTCGVAKVRCEPQ